MKRSRFLGMVIAIVAAFAVVVAGFLISVTPMEDTFFRPVSDGPSKADLRLSLLNQMQTGTSTDITVDYELKGSDGYATLMVTTGSRILLVRSVKDGKGSIGFTYTAPTRTGTQEVLATLTMSNHAAAVVTTSSTPVSVIAPPSIPND